MALPSGEAERKRARQAEQEAQMGQLTEQNRIMLNLFTARSSDLLAEEMRRVDGQFEQRLTEVESKQSASPATRSGGSSTASGGVWVASHLDIKVCEFHQRESLGVTIATVQTWWQQMDAQLPGHITGKLGPVRAKVPDNIFKFQLSNKYPKINVENSPERIAKFQAFGSLSDAVSELAQAKGLTVTADWKKTLTVKVEVEGQNVTIGGISCTAGVVWDLQGIEKAGWTKEAIELRMRKWGKLLKESVLTLQEIPTWERGAFGKLQCFTEATGDCGICVPRPWFSEVLREFHHAQFCALQLRGAAYISLHMPTGAAGAANSQWIDTFTSLSELCHQWETWATSRQRWIIGGDFNLTLPAKLDGLTGSTIPIGACSKYPPDRVRQVVNFLRARGVYVPTTFAESHVLGNEGHLR
ncbi:unnamed protein product, partial [Prorocentrum cordatum]